MNYRLLSLRALQLYAIANGVIAVIGGGTFVWFGSEGLSMVVGVKFPALAPLLEQTAISIEPGVRVTFDTWYRALGWYWLVTGLMLFWITPNIQNRTDWFRFIHIGFMAVGIANLMTIIQSGVNVHSRYLSVVIEIGVPILSMLWQWSVARSASVKNN